MFRYGLLVSGSLLGLGEVPAARNFSFLRAGLGLKPDSTLFLVTGDFFFGTGRFRTGRFCLREMFFFFGMVCVFGVFGS